MPAKRLPLNVLELTGSYRTHKAAIEQRKAQEAFREQGFPPFRQRVPAWMSKGEKRAWKEIVESVPKGYFNRADELFVEQAARILAAVREIDHTDPDNRTIINALHSRLPTYYKMLGITADMTRVPAKLMPKAKKEKGGDGFGDL